MTKKGNAVRFGVKSVGGKKSTTWNLSQGITKEGKEEIYIAWREIDVLKLSLHDSGFFWVNFTKSYFDKHPEFKAQQKDKRYIQDIVPKEVTAGQHMIAKIIVPHTALTTELDKDNAVTWLPDPGEGNAVQFIIAITDQPITDWPGAGENTKLVGSINLKNNRVAWVVAFIAVTPPLNNPSKQLSPTELLQALKMNKILFIGTDESGITCLYDQALQFQYPEGKVAFFTYMLKIQTNCPACNLPRGRFFNRFRHMVRTQ